MALPDLIEIVPLAKPVRAEITVPGSKSITNRALILAALAEGEVTLQGALWSEDTQVMVEALQKLGFAIKVEPDPDEFCNRTITVKGLGGKIPNTGTPEMPLELFVGNAGTAARFLSAMVCLGNGACRLSGVARMHKRPQAALFKALRELGYRVDSPNDKLPATIFGRDAFHRVPDSKVKDGDAVERIPTKRSCTVSIEDSSQFASALLLCARHGGWDVKVVGENAEESPYVAMTLKLIEAFPEKGGTFQIEPDASSGSYFWAAGVMIHEAISLESRFDLPVAVSNWPDLELQIDAEFPRFMPICGVQSPTWISRQTHLGDSIMTAIVITPLADHAVEFANLGRLRVQECERVVALRTELTKCGAKVIEEGDTLTVWPSQLHGAEIETYNDHRMAMCFAILGLKVTGIKIKNPACVKKTFPNFFQKLAAPPPNGLGAEIRDGRTGRKLEVSELFAE
ncbi:MAG: 3-phosphoshikimate 1-carboxyvinyltransferase [Verrucomicrobia bacterium]|jgi:3-phosphoshikimate 1-carboxyvinyltransferase|nr:3-phosphoshikimate 1-carboxyvinyltransferase [Verrucomicrobiota bacterium]